jgi:sarcosine oxidase, subunit alpha
MRRLDPGTGPDVTIDFEGKAISARVGEPAACALLAAGESVFSRSIKYHRPRGPFCMAASCSQCLMRIDGLPNRFSCQTPVHEGMRLERQNAFPTAGVDVFASIDWMFPRGLDHHSMFAGVPVADKVMAVVARQLAGLGLLPDAVEPAPRPPERLDAEVTVVGGGTAGLAAARALSAAGIPVLILEAEDRLGGRLVLEAPEEHGEARATSAPSDAKVRLRTGALALYDDELGRVLVAVEHGPEAPRLMLIKSRSVLFALGGHAGVLPFENNDIPGVFSGRAASDLLLRRRLLVGDAPALIGHGSQLTALQRMFEQEGARPVLVLDVRAGPGDSGVVAGQPLRAHGRTWVHGLSYRTAEGRVQRTDCDAVVVSLPPAPAFELPRQAGVKVAFQPALETFAPVAEADGRTAVHDIWVAGDVRQPGTVRDAIDSGRRAGEALARTIR